MIEETTAEERFQHSPRPLRFIRVRLHRGGQVEFIRDILNDEKDALFDDLGKMRDQGLPEDDPKVAKVRDQLRWLINAIRDIDQGTIELVGSGGSE
jgi:hypothetical protein